MDIRIGNDIKLNVTLQVQNDLDQANIKLIEAYFTNTAMEEFLDPAAPFMPMGCSCDSICGRKGYHFPVFNAGCCSGCLGHGGCCGHYYHDYWWRPFRFDNGVLIPNYGHPFCRHHCFPKAGRPQSFLAPHELTSEKNKIEVYFPAQMQVAEGDYTLIVVAYVYKEGWGRKDLRAYTMDYGKIFTLTDDENAMSGNIEIDVYGGSVIPVDDSLRKVIPGYIGTTNVVPGNNYIPGNDMFQSNVDPDLPAGASNVNLSDLVQYENIVGTNTIYTNTGQFLWIVADAPVKTVSAGSFDVPLSDPEIYNNKYYYACLNPLFNNKSFNLTIGG